MRIFKVKLFARFARKEKITDEQLCDEIGRIGRGLIDAKLGDNVIKQRIARPGQGRSGGYRVIVLIRIAELAFFVFGFAKSRMADIEPSDVGRFRDMAAKLLSYSDDELEHALGEGEIVEIFCNGDENIPHRSRRRRPRDDGGAF